MTGALIIQLTVGGLFAAGAAAAAAYTAWRTMRGATRAQRGQRFGDASRALGSDRLERRLNAIHELRDLARERPEDAGRVVVLLCGFLRDHASLTAPRARVTVGEIQEALRSIRELLKSKKWRHAAIVDLSGTALAGLDLSHLRIRRGNFSRSQLGSGARDWQAAKFCHSDLRDADFSGSWLSWVTFQGAQLRGSTFAGSRLRAAIFVGATLRGADFRAADCRGSSFDHADTRGVDFRGADLSGASGLTLDQLDAARVNEETILPERLRSRGPWLYEVLQKAVVRLRDPSEWSTQWEKTHA